MGYTSLQVAQMFDVSRETIRQWTQEFEKYLSRSATPEPGRHRQYTEDDIRVLSLVAELRDKNFLYDDIGLALENGERGILPNMPVTDIETESDLKKRMMIVAQQMQKIVAENQALREENQNLLLLRDQNLIAQARMEALQHQLNEAKEEIRRLYRQIARLEIRLEDPGDE